MRPSLRTGRIAAWVAAGLLAAVAVFQVALVAGAPWGSFTQGGANSGALPLAARGFAAVSLLLVVVMALGLLARVGQGPMARAPRRLVTVLAWFTTVYAALGLVANLATPSAVERAVWAPVTAALLVCAMLVMVSTSRRVAADGSVVS